MTRLGSWRAHWRGFLLSVSLIGLLLGWAQIPHAQNAPTEQSPSLKAIPHWRFPLISQSSRDGLLIGFDLRLTVGSYEPNVGTVYGLGSQAFRYRYGVTIAQLLSAEYRDWPGSPVLGREGGRGLQLALSLGGLAVRGFYGLLWQTPRESQDPAVAYLQISDQLQWGLPLGAQLQLALEVLGGAQLTAPKLEIFRTLSGSARLTLDQTTFTLQYGQLANPGGLADLRFRFGLRSYPATFQGDRLLVASLERRFDLFTAQLSNIDVSSSLGPASGSAPGLPRAFLDDLQTIFSLIFSVSGPISLRAQGELFFEGGEVWLSDVSQGGVLSGWGVGLILPDLGLRLDAAVNAQGEPRFHLQSSLVEF